MDHVSYTQLRENLKKHLEDVCDRRAPLMVTRRNGEPVVMLSLAEYESLEGSPHLLRDPANAQRLLRLIAEAEAGRLVEHDLQERSSYGATTLGRIISTGTPKTAILFTRSIQ